MKSKTWITNEKNKIVLNEKIIKDDNIIITTLCSAICGTDLHVWEGHDNAKRPLSQGHEFIGRIERLPEYVKTDTLGNPLIVGDRVIVAPGYSCGKCVFCKKYHNPNICVNRTSHGLSSISEKQPVYGGFSEKVSLIKGAKVYKIPSKMKNCVAVLAEPLTVALRALEKVTGNNKVTEMELVTLGMGPIALLIAILAKKRGMNVNCVEPNMYRCEYVKKFGITTLTYEEIQQLNNGIGPDYIIECTGEPQAFKNGILSLRKGGRMVVVGHFFHNGTCDIDPWYICKQELEIVGSVLGNEECYEEAIDILSDESINWEKVVSHQYSFYDGEKAFDLAKTRQCMKVVLCKEE